jgi:aminopeptidase N
MVQRLFSPESDFASTAHKPFELPGARPHYNPDRPGQVEHICLDLQLDIPRQICAGTCTIRLNPVRSGITSLTLDAVEMQIEAVSVGSEPQGFDYDGNQLHISLGSPTAADRRFELCIHYRLEQPRRGMYFVGPDVHYPAKPVQVWTQGEDEDSRFWFPCFDYPGQLTTSEIRVQVPSPYQAISNGELVSAPATVRATADQPDGKIYHWIQKQVHPTYLMTLAVGDFVELQEEWRGKPVTYYVQPGQEAQARLTLGKTPQMMEFFSQTYGYDYPYSKYAQVCVEDFIFGGMENTSTTLLTSRCLIDERAALDNLSSETLVAHELAHQWFGDLAVIKHWSHAWIKEGMATYAEVLWMTHEYGADRGSYYLLGQARQYLSEDADRYRRPLVTHVYREAIELYDSHIYEKGACVYHMIHAELGDELFGRAIAQFLADNAHGTVETIDLLRAIEKATGRNLTYLFDQYVYRGGHPDYKVAYSWDADSSLAQVTVTQTQVQPGKTQDLFDLKLPIGFGYLPTVSDPNPIHSDDRKTNLKTFPVRIHEAEQSFYFPLSRKPDFVSFDVGNHALKTVTLSYPLPELKAQLQHDPDNVSRLYAAHALAKVGGLEAVKALTGALKTESCWGVRSEICKALANIKLDQALEGLLLGLQDAAPQVRRAAVQALATIKTPHSYSAIRALATAGDASYLVEAAALRALGGFTTTGMADAPAVSAVIELLQSALTTRQGWNSVVQVGAIGALSQMTTSTAALTLLLDYTQLGQPQALRGAAIKALGAISTGQGKPLVEPVLNRLRDLAREPLFMTQVAVVVALEQMEAVAAIGILQEIADQAADGRVRRMAEEGIGMVQARAGSEASVQQLRQEFDQLKQENQTLKSRLEILEAKSTQPPSP